MNIIAKELGYRELDRIKEFIEIINRGNEHFSFLISNYDVVTISYDRYADEPIILAKNCNQPFGIKFYPADIEIEL